MPGLDVTKVPFDLILNIVNILVMFVIVRLLVYKPVRRFLDERNRKMAEAKENAEKAMQEAQEMQAKYRQLLEENDEQADKLMKKTRDEAERQAQDHIAAARKKADAMLADARDIIAQRESESLLAMQEKVIDLSLSIASKIMDENMDDEHNRRLAEKFFNSELNSGN